MRCVRLYLEQCEQLVPPLAKPEATANAASEEEPRAEKVSNPKCPKCGEVMQCIETRGLRGATS